MTPILPTGNNPVPDYRTGVFICDCGGEISNCLDTEALAKEAELLPGVIYAAREAYPCSPDGRQRIKKAIKEHHLERLLVAGCTPRLVEKLFQGTAKEAGLETDSLHVVDIREQCAYIHPGGGSDSQVKAENLIQMGLAYLENISRGQTIRNRVSKSALVIGGSLAGLAAAVDLANNGILVTLAVPTESMLELAAWSDEPYREAAGKMLEAVADHPQIIPLHCARVLEVTGSAGNYQVAIAHGEQTTRVLAGAILIAGDAHSQELGVQRWYDRRRVKTQSEFAKELQAGENFEDIVMIFCQEDQHCSRLCCQTGINQALHARRLNPQANITILYRQLYLGRSEDGAEAILKEALQAGIAFFRYAKGIPPKVEEKTVQLYDPLTEAEMDIPYDRVVLTTPLLPDENVGQLAALLRLPTDQQGYLIEPRIRLRPGRYSDDGIFVLGGAHQPSSLQETLYQAYLVSARAQRFLSQEYVSTAASTVQVDSRLCTGCGECIPICSAGALRLEKQDSILSLSTVNPFRCTGCGDCAVACPVKAITIPGWEDGAILAQITSALRLSDEKQGLTWVTQSAPKVLVLACEWSAYAAADIAGARKNAYPSNVRIIRLGCSARVDPEHILWAFLNGAQGVFVGACPAGECHHGLGNLHATNRIDALKLQLAEHAIDPRRLRLEFLAADDGKGFAAAISRFIEEISVVSVNNIPAS